MSKFILMSALWLLPLNSRFYDLLFQLHLSQVVLFHYWEAKVYLCEFRSGIWVHADGPNKA